jgi:murein DD-endopeptidase MepM/ murein hydrolase activator NlpD/pimeloyl-ACP methyl ester carboxylesterase
MKTLKSSNTYLGAGWRKPIPCIALISLAFHFVADAQDLQLSFPLRTGLFTNAWTAPITSVFDHSADARYCSNGVVVAFTGETANVRNVDEPPVAGSCGGHLLFSYKKADGTVFYVNGHYVGTSTTGANTLNYDGHPGYDYPVASNTPVYAAADGVVVTAVPTDSSSSGKYIQIEHVGGQYLSQYLHLSRVDVSTNQTVLRGDLIGMSGSSGGVTAHLHFETKVKMAGDWISIDPYGWLGTGPDPYTLADNRELWIGVPTEKITDIMSPIVSYQFPNDIATEALTNGGLMSPVASYQYYEWPGDDVLQLKHSPSVSYYYQFLITPPLVLIPTDRTPTAAESTPAIPVDLPTMQQLKQFELGEFKENPNSPPDPNRMTVVLTHGWNSNPDEWAKAMAAAIVESCGISTPNIFAWDWSVSASSMCNVGKIAKRTPAEGCTLGAALQQKLGLAYAQPIHFIGHSLGTLVNARAADYLHGDKGANPTVSSTHWSAANTHMTLLDEAELGTSQGCVDFIVDLVSLITKWRDPLKPGSNYEDPLPAYCAWADNYISAFGLPNRRAANVVLTNEEPVSATGLGALVEALKRFHGYPHQWYRASTGSAGSLISMGFHKSFEKAGLNPVPAVGVSFVQSLTSSELEITSCTYEAAEAFLQKRAEHYSSFLKSSDVEIGGNTLTANGQIMGEMMAFGPYGAWSVVLKFMTGAEAVSLQGPRPPGRWDWDRTITGPRAPWGHTHGGWLVFPPMRSHCRSTTGLKASG